MSSLGGERYSVQKPVIDYVQEQSTEYTSPDGRTIFLRLGWEYLKPDDALRLRGGSTGIVFREIFINQMQRLNPDFMDNLMAEDIIKKLSNILPNIEGNFTAWEYLKGIKTVFVPGEKRERNIRFLDTADVNRNTFHVTDEFVFTSGNKTIRPDIVFLINGLSVLFVETKATHCLAYTHSIQVSTHMVYNIKR